jgi:hypothetical protein
VASLVEVKQGKGKIDPNLWHFSEKYRFPAVQLVYNLRIPRDKGRVEIRDAATWLAGLEDDG